MVGNIPGKLFRCIFFHRNGHFLAKIPQTTNLPEKSFPCPFLFYTLVLSSLRGGPFQAKPLVFALLFLISELRFVDFGNFPAFFSPHRSSHIMFFSYYLLEFTFSVYQASALFVKFSFHAFLSLVPQPN